MATVNPESTGTTPPCLPELKEGLVEALTAAYATLLKRQRTASAAFVRWTAAHTRAHEFAWVAAGRETLLHGGEKLKIEQASPIFSSIQKMKATIELNHYERELQYGYPYLVGQSDGVVYRAPLFTIPIEISAEGSGLSISLAEDNLRFNSLPFRSEKETGNLEHALTRLITTCPELPLTPESLAAFSSSVTRELGVRISARLDGTLDGPPAMPGQTMRLTLIDNAACFIAPKTSYFLVSDLEAIGKAGSPSVAASALGWLIGRRPPEPTSDRFTHRSKLFYPFPSNSSQKRVAHLVDDPKSRITVIQGPPGTGKSLTIANLACHLIASGKRVLITSQKDKALQVVDELLNSLSLPELPMTLLRQDRESKKQLQERLESIQKERSAEEARQLLELQIQNHKRFVGEFEKDENDLNLAILAEHPVERADVDARLASGMVAKIKSRWKLRKSLRHAERHAQLRSDVLGRKVSEKRDQLRSLALSLLKHAATHRTCSAQKAERNQLRELAKLLGRNQTNARNFPIFDRMKTDPEKCKMLLNILPCWIMSPDDVARLFPCKPGLFDVVIIDEASQCDLPSMTPVLFRANQLVVAGDSKQMQAQRFAFTSNLVAAQEWAQQSLDLHDPDHWLDPTKIDLLQLSSIRMDEEVFLDEHYRSLPAIISFSNERWYRNRLRIMRGSDDKRCGDPDSPAIVLHRVAGKVAPGSQENEIEAKALAGHLHELMENPEYAGATFGVICLFEEQMRLASDLISEAIPEELCLDHDLVVVNPDGFQGDERDVILYSLSYDADGMGRDSLSARQSDREHIQGMLNVAFTRAKDEIHIFHSAEISEFAMANGTGVIKDWLSHCAAQKPPIDLPAGNIENKLALAQSQFEQQVMRALHEKGISVRPQFPSCGYFIDVVAESEGNRIAIECDGEIWHLDEHGQLKTEDIERQEVLERAGWDVVRVPYRSWRENPQAQLQRLLDELTGKGDETDASIETGSTPASSGAPLAIEKFQHAITQSLKDGAKTESEVFRIAREKLGYSRMGPKIRESLEEALEDLSRSKIVRLEEGEVFFLDEDARKREYTIAANLVPDFWPKPARPRRHRRSYRYRRW
jgi:very-short-patch-repair endonuclease